MQSVSPLDEITNRGAEIRTRLHQLLRRHEYTNDAKMLVLVAYVDIALEHHAAIWLLAKSELTGSSVALVRSVFETMLRALWVNAVATEEQAKQAWLDELEFPKGSKLRAEIQHAYFGERAVKDPELAETVENFFELLKGAWRILNSYAHSSGRQIARRFTGEEVRPNYTEHETAQALNLTTVALLLLLRGFFMSINFTEAADKTAAMLMQYSTEFNDRLRSGQ
jgi:hypothetical protein